MRIALLGCFAMLLSLARAAEAELGRCERLAAPLLFVGTIRDVKKLPGVHPTLDFLLATFAVDEVLRGQLGPTVVFELQVDKERCAGRRVAVGEKFLISTWETHTVGDRPRVVNCRALWHGAAVAGEVAFVKGAASRKTAIIEGTIAIHDDPFHLSHAQQRASAVVRAAGTGYTARTRSDGFYRLFVPPGRYELEIIPDDPGLVEVGLAEPRRFQTQDKQAQVAAGSCTTRDYTLAWNGRIRGRLTDHLGRPAGGVEVYAYDTRHLTPASEWGPHAVTAADGTYEIPYVQPGAHLVAVSVPYRAGSLLPSTFYPGAPSRAKARPVQVARGKPVTGIDFQLRAPQPLRWITGTVKPIPPPSQPQLVIIINNAAEDRTLIGTVHSDSASASEGAFDVQEAADANLVLRACRGGGTFNLPSEDRCGPPVKLPPGGDRSVALQGPPPRKDATATQ